jgi:uncharacterized protein YecT (DUF1311 family)
MKRIGLLLAFFCLPGSGCERTVSADQHAGLDKKEESMTSEPAARPLTTYAGRADAQELGGRPDGDGFYGKQYGLRPDYEACMTRQPESASTAGHRQDCAEEEFEFQDTRLNRVYRKAVETLAGRDDRKAAATQLRDAQRRWLSQLDETCEETAEKASPSMGPAALSTCLMNLTAMRADELERTHVDARK